jgi:hypothetical protein
VPTPRALSPPAEPPLFDWQPGELDACSAELHAKLQPYAAGASWPAAAADAPEPAAAEAVGQASR